MLSTKNYGLYIKCSVTLSSCFSGIEGFCLFLRFITMRNIERQKDTPHPPLKHPRCQSRGLGVGEKKIVCWLVFWLRKEVQKVIRDMAREV